MSKPCVRKHFRAGRTSSFSSLAESAAADRATVISTSSMSLDISLNTFFHSSANGPVDVSFAMVPTFFYSLISVMNKTQEPHKVLQPP